MSGAVYPPEVAAAWLGRSIEWAARRWSVIVWNEDRTRVLAHVGLVDRWASLNGTDVKIGGIGGVMTHPEFRNQGFAREAIHRSLGFFQEQADFDMALLVCEPALIPFYGKLGWRSFPGKLLVTQRGHATEFTFNLPMLFPIRGPYENDGVLDLQGPPW